MRYRNYIKTRFGTFYMEEEAGTLVRLEAVQLPERGSTAVAGRSEPETAKSETPACSDLKNDAEEHVILQDTPLLSLAEEQFLEYLEGKRRTFTIPMTPQGTAFQKKVWRELMQIPYGETRTYGQIAEAIGSPKASRAVGGACNKNPILVLIPCHRVIGSSGKLVGFGAGLPLKEQLLAIEKRT